MSTLVKRKVHEPSIAEGWHNATIDSVKAEYGVTTNYGVKDRATIEFEVGGTYLKLRCTLSLNPKSKLYGVIAELAGGAPGEEYDLEDLVGLRCRVLVSHYESDSGDVWENIDKVKAIGRQLAKPEISDEDVPF